MQRNVIRFQNEVHNRESWYSLQFSNIVGISKEEFSTLNEVEKAVNKLKISRFVKTGIEITQVRNPLLW